MLITNKLFRPNSAIVIVLIFLMKDVCISSVYVTVISYYNYTSYFYPI